MSVVLMGGLALSAYACSGDSAGAGDGNDDSGGSGGSAGSGGSGGGSGGSGGGSGGSDGGAGGSDGGAGGSDGGASGSSTNGGSGGGGGTLPSPECTEDADCEDAGMLCDPLAERCVECLFDSDCGNAERCAAKTCVEAVECESPVDCDGVDDATACDSISGHCVECISSSDCSATADCIDHECRPYVECSNARDCPAAQVCDSDAGRCVQCVSTSDCDDGMKCVSNSCRPGCLFDIDCTALGLLCNSSLGVCVRCEADTNCPDAYHCSAADGRCLLDSCERDSGYCEDNSLFVCDASGSGYEAQVCSSSQTCVQGEQASCQDHVCTPGVDECSADDSEVVTCAADGLGFEVSTDCSATDEVCYLGTCQAFECAPNSYFCQDNALHLCYSDGLGSALLLTCPEEQRCDAEATACVDLLCTPDEPICNGSIATTCNGEGDGYVADGTDCTDADEACVDGECKDCTASILLLGGAETDDEAITQAALETAGMLVTLISNGVASYTGTPAAAGFGAVVASVGAQYTSDMDQAGQDSIVTAHAAGTGYVTNEYASLQQYLGNSSSLGPLTLLSFGDADTPGGSVTSTSSGHPIWDGVPSTFALPSSLAVGYGQLINSGVAIATCSDCNTTGTYSGAFVAVREASGGRLVHFAHAGNSTNAYLDPKLLKMFVNAAEWATGCK